MLGRPISLMEVLAKKAGCEVISDLRYLSKKERKRLAQGIVSVSSAQFSLREWNDALDYVVRAPPERSVDQARTRLMECLDPAAKLPRI